MITLMCQLGYAYSTKIFDQVLIKVLLWRCSVDTINIDKHLTLYKGDS